MGLARSRGWQSLLHYRPKILGGVASEVDGREFFLSPTGRTDPQAELEATLRAFFLPFHENEADGHALCRFPARRRWLDERLHFAGTLHAPTCPALDRYLGALEPEAIAVVYSAPYLGNAVSAFGHTFLRIRKARPAGATEPGVALDYGVDFIAIPDTKNPFLYVYRGIAGVFPGVVRFHSYAYKAREYGVDEGRDLWEYDLAPWDIAAGSLLVREAGGRVSAIDGSAFRVDGISTLASNGHIHAEMIAALEPS